MQLTSVKSLKGTLTVPGDKSISHRSIMLGSLASGVTEVHNFLQGADCLSSIGCFRAMGVEIENDNANDIVRIHGNGIRGLKAPTSILNVGNSGTTLRLMSGILSAQDFYTAVHGDASIQKRPIKRVITPLSLMGAKIVSIRENDCAPFQVTGTALKGITYHSPVASAQVKSAILLAGLYANGETTVIEPSLSRNHTELMFKMFGADIQTEGVTATVRPVSELYAQRINIPGDISSAAYFIVAGLITPNSEICITNVGINPTRDGIIQVCKAMGADITLENIRGDEGEPVADIVVRTSELHGTTIGSHLIPTLIDEIPVIAVMACFAKGQTIIKDAQELKVKESNRIDMICKNLSAMGADITPTDDGMIIEGGQTLKGAVIDSHLDHRIAMSFAIAALNAEGVTEITDAQCVDISYPGFFKDLEALMD